MNYQAKTPWSEDQVASLNGYQNAGIFHPYTCGKCRRDLIATKDGWICECGEYTQDWALAFMANWEWKKMDWREMFKEKNENKES